MVNGVIAPVLAILMLYYKDDSCNSTLYRPAVITCSTSTCFRILKLRSLPTQCIYVLRIILTKTAVFSVNSINRLVFVAEM
jgi:lipopolysaccharide/colanic/teichoic acid biosynthesis glycosyltransferase